MQRTRLILAGVVLAGVTAAVAPSLATARSSNGSLSGAVCLDVPLSKTTYQMNAVNKATRHVYWITITGTAQTDACRARVSFDQSSLPAGTYAVSFDHASGYSLTAGGYYKGIAEIAGVDGATDVRVNAGENTPLGTVKRSASTTKFAGYVKTTSGAGHAGWPVIAVPTNSKLSTRHATTTSTGHWVMPGLNPGTYKVFVWNGGSWSTCTEKLIAKKDAVRGQTVNLGTYKWNARSC